MKRESLRLVQFLSACLVLIQTSSEESVLSIIIVSILFCVFFWVVEFVYLSLTPDSFDVLVVQSAHQSFKDALGDGIWLTLLDSKTKTNVIDASASMLQFKDMQLFHRFENDGNHVELPWNKVTVLFNLARLLEQIHDTVAASVLYRLILFKVGMHVHANFPC